MAENECGAVGGSRAAVWFAVSIAWLLTVLTVAAAVARAAVQGGRTILRSDLPVLEYLARHRSGALTVLAQVVSAVASPVGLVLTLLLLLVSIRWRRGSFEQAAFALVTLFGVGLIDNLIKNVVARPRPPISWRVLGVSAQGLSFPSGHTIQSAAIYGAIAVILCRANSRIRPWAAGFVWAAVIVAVGLSRLYLGVHWLSDVLAGALFGASWLLVVLTGAAVIGDRLAGPATAGN